MVGTMWQGVPQPRDMTPDMRSDLDQALMQVNPNNVLDVRRAILTECQRLGEYLRLDAQGMRVDNCGSDPVSPLAAAAFNEKIGPHLREAQNYVNSLFEAGQMLAKMARSYGHTEAEIAASFQGGQA